MGEPALKFIITEKPRIYVTCLAAYNNGHLHGAWVDAAQDAWAIWGTVQKMLAASPVGSAGEWAIHDHEGFGRLRISESASFETVASLAAFIAEHGALGAAVLCHFDGDLAESREALSDRYIGCYNRLADYMQEITEETAEMPASLLYYIDWEAMARDAEINGDFFTVQTSWDAAHVFAGR